MAKAALFGAKIEGGEELLEEMRALGVNVRKTLIGATRAAMKVVQAEAELRAKPLSTRRGKATRLVFSSKKRDHATADVGPSKKKWMLRFFEQGVTRHEIVAGRHSPALVFEGNRGLVVLTRVNHPGMAARPWLRPAMDGKRDEATKVFGQALRAAIEEKRIAAEGSDDEE